MSYIILAVIFAYLVFAHIMVYKLRKKRDVLNLFTTFGQAKKNQLNRKINTLTGAWLLNWKVTRSNRSSEKL